MWCCWTTRPRRSAKEIVRCGGLEGRVHMALDYFDASINRVSAWVDGLPQCAEGPAAWPCSRPTSSSRRCRTAASCTELMVRQEELKTMPFGEIWDEYCRRCGAPVDGEWFPEVQRYEQDVQLKRV